MNEVMPRDRPGRHDIVSQEEAWPQQFVIGNDEAELELSVESRSFVSRVKDQVRKKTEKNFECYRRRRKTFYDLENVHGCNNGISSIHGKELPNNCHSSVNTTDLTLKQMFDISTRWIGNNWLGESFMEISVINW